MAKRKQPDSLGFVAPAALSEAATEADPFAQLMDTSVDDQQATEVDPADAAVLDDVFRDVVACTRRKDEIDAELSVAKKNLTGAKERMAAVMERQGTKQFRALDGDGSCTITETYATTIDDVDAWMGWVQENASELLTVHSQTRTKYVRENFRDKGVPVDSDAFPPGITVKPIPGLMVRGAKAPKPKRKEAL